MPRTAEDVENFLIALNRPYETDAGTFLVGSSGPPIALRVAPPIVELQLDIGQIPGEAKQALFFRRLLELNATDLIHASYGLEGDRVILSAALELENLDQNELEAV